MSSVTCPALAWRNTLLEVVTLEAEGGPTGPSWQISAGTFADDHADTIRTSLVRGLAEGRVVSLTAGGGVAPLTHITRAEAGCGANRGALTQLSEARAALRAFVASPVAPSEPCDGGAHNLAVIEKAIDRARARAEEAATQREAAIQWLIEDTRKLEAARAEVAGLEQRRAALLASGTEA